MAIQELGYLVFGSADIAGWRELGTDVIGLMATDAIDGATYLKMDDRDFRIAIVPDSEERLIGAGFEAPTPEEYAALRKRLEAAGVETHDGTADEVKLRRVQEFFWCKDPAGNRAEVYWGHISNFKPFISPIGLKSFVTGGLGLGHVVLPVADIDEAQKFWIDIMGFGLSDILTMDFGAHEVKIYFNHCNNGRQHSVALARMPSPNGCVHFMLEMPTLKDVGQALDRVNDRQIPLMMTLGQHVNDDCVSFYFRSKQGFMIELGWDGLVKDWTKHSVFETTLPSVWGHRFVG
ncbi:MAG: VOC family protein [Sphingomonadaceae bacterium]